MDNYKDTILAQYANSPIITELITDFNEWIDPSVNLNEFYKNIWDIQTANDAGLDVWGKIVNISRYLKITDASPSFGFKEAYTVATQATGAQPFNQAPFYSGGATTTYKLGTEAYRQLILVKAMANITNCTVPSLNKLLNFLFSGSGRCYVHDTGDMSVRFVFEFTLSSVQMAIMLNSGAVPHSAGVQVQILTVDPSSTFGFNGSNCQPFNQGAFFSNSGIKYAN